MTSPAENHPSEPLRARRGVPAWGATSALLLALAAGCTSEKAAREAAQAARTAEEARVRRAAEDWLRALFPEIEGEISRAAIERALLVDAPVTTDASTPNAAVAPEDVPAQAIAAVRRGDFVRARSLLGELVTQTDLARARALLAEGDERGAIAALDRAVATAPDSVELRLLRGESLLKVGLRDGASDSLAAALEDFEEAVRKRGGPRAQLGASRAARALGRTEPALTYARSAVDALAGADLAVAGAPTPERVWAQASLDAFERTPAGQGANGGAGGELALESRSALESALARAPEDPWTWRRLSAFELERGDVASARATSAFALRLFPADAELHATFARATSAVAGPDAVVSAYEELRARAGDVARVAASLGRARLEAASAARARGAGDPDAFAAAETELARAAELAARDATSATATDADAARALLESIALDRAACRAGVGHARLARGDLEGARSAFLSIEDVARGALTATREGSPSGFDGLAQVAAAFAERGSKDGAPEDLERAARIEQYLREYAPRDAQVAARAARRQRDAAIATELAARRVDGAERARTLVRARELMDTSHAAYDAALALAPDDARLALESGLVLTNYLQREPTVATERLNTAVRALETRRVELRARAGDAALDGATRAAAQRALEEVESALADAFQALGVVEYTLKGDPAAARQFFERCVATSPDPRDDVRGKGGWIERCDAAVRDGVDTRITDATRWAAAPR